MKCGTVAVVLIWNVPQVHFSEYFLCRLGHAHSEYTTLCILCGRPSVSSSPQWVRNYEPFSWKHLHQSHLTHFYTFFFLHVVKNAWKRSGDTHLTFGCHELMYILAFTICSYSLLHVTEFLKQHSHSWDQHISVRGTFATNGCTHLASRQLNCLPLISSLYLESNHIMSVLECNWNNNIW